ncbi:hypothetical protein L1987_04824 [Smallanthus sonchifolius]|uniref:Uncharacterized protein n=1 Tax=Smallanthus sonchifolius TaxID=185202 RepID=A0ACB9JTN7_9ASTR|nr:hypothetical protein L1987_04824 [Smallanthus sonchifolius]
MESESIQPTGKECEPCCSCCEQTLNRSCSKTWYRSVKRKLDELEIETRSFIIPGLSTPEVARVEIENECRVLRKMVTNQQQSIHDLAVELEEERNASSSAANEAMSMILRLQHEKAEIEMEARQFKRFSEQKSSHDQQEIAALEELLYKREQTIQSLTCEVQAYKYRMMSYGLTESEAEGVKGMITNGNNSIATNSVTEFSRFDNYPPLKCHSHEQQPNPELETELEKYTFTETPRHQPILDKVIIGHSLRIKKPSTRFSLDSACSLFATIKEYDHDSNLKKVENCSEFGSEISDRIYTVDSIHYGQPNVNTYDDVVSSRKDSVCHSEIKDPEVMKLYARLHALEADRESMRQAIVNMRTDKAQLVLLKEIAQNLCKDMAPTSRMPVKRKSGFRIFGQSVASFVLWRRNAGQTK